MNLPENKKVNRDGTKKLKVWVYGQPNIGKTTFASQFPNALMLNTDGNYKYFDTPVITIAGDDKLDPWEQFSDVVDTLVKGNNTYETIVVDLLEDVYQYCRAHFCKLWKVDHESDLGGYSKGYDIIRNVYLITLRRLVNANYNIVFASHESSKVVKDRVGKETTVFETPISDKVAIKIQGMVELTGRISIKSTTNESGEVTDTRILNLTSSKEQFGGNKIPTLTEDYIVLSYDNLIKAIGKQAEPVIRATVKKETPPVIKKVEESVVTPETTNVVETPVKSSRIGMKITRKNKEEK